MEQRNENKTELKMIKMSDVQSQTVDWLWYPFIPYGKLTIIQGDPGDGKTTLILNIAARLSKGEGLGNDMKVTEPVKIIYLFLYHWEVYYLYPVHTRVHWIHD